MVVIEAGIIDSGLPILRLEYHDSKGDADLRAGFFEALNSFAREAFSDVDRQSDDQRQELKMRNVMVFLQPIQLQKQKKRVLIYTISDNAEEAVAIKKAMAKIENTLENRLQIKDVADTDYYEKHYSDIFDVAFKDLVERESQRVSRLF